MKTKTQNSKTGLESRPEQLSTPKSETQTPKTSAAAPVTPAPDTKAQRPPLPPLDYDKRREYRTLSTDRVLALLRNEAPKFFGLAEIVGKWVWIQFTEKQPREVTSTLSQLGFHWNNKRQAWQHPCGQFTLSTPKDPRAKYGSRHAADEVPA